MKLKETLRRKAKGKKGFTLVELVIVIAVLAIIAAIAIPTVSNVIGNANAAADASNAQSIELAIKTSQAEVAANVTHQSTRAQDLIGTTGQGTLATLLPTYGVSTDTITKPKVSGDKFYYDATSGKVTASTSAVSNTIALNTTTPYAIHVGTDKTVTTDYVVDKTAGGNLFVG